MSDPTACTSLSVLHPGAKPTSTGRVALGSAGVWCGWHGGREGALLDGGRQNGGRGQDWQSRLCWLYMGLLGFVLDK